MCVCCSCNEGGSNLKVKISSSEKTLIELVSKIYSDQELLKIVQFNGSIKDLDIQYSIECLRYNNDIYRVSYLGNSSVAVILYDGSGNKISGGIHSTQKLKSDFSGITRGQLLEDVRKLDPTGEYLFLYTGRDDVPKISFHYTKDGYLIAIEYDDTNTVVSLKEELI